MFIRLMYFNFFPEKSEEFRKIYLEEIAPQVRKQVGNLDCRLLEPLGASDNYISMSMWDSQRDADRYYSSAFYNELNDKVKSFYSKPPMLKIYEAENVMEPA